MRHIEDIIIYVCSMAIVLFSALVSYDLWDRGYYPMAIGAACLAVTMLVIAVYYYKKLYKRN